VVVAVLPEAIMQQAVVVVVVVASFTKKEFR
jgi:hypothetical protein